MSRAINYSQVPAEKLVIEIIGVDVHESGASCPHCGAQGKRIHRFVTADGKTHGAMSGCYKKFFFVAPIAHEIQFAQRMVEKYPGWKKMERQLESLKNQRQLLIGGLK
jgi:hypothetical protein